MAQSPPAPQEVLLALGDSYKINSPPQEAVWVSEASVLKVSDAGSQLQLLSRALGQSLVQIGQRTYNIRVVPRTLYQSWLKANEVTQDFKGLLWKIEDTKLQLTGTLLRELDWHALAREFRGAETSYEFKATIDQDLTDSLLKHFLRLAQRAGLPPPHLSLSEGLVRIGQQHQASLSKYQAIYRPYGIEVQVEASELGLAPLIRLQVVIAEVHSNESLKLGIRWPGQQEMQVLPQTLSPSQIMVELQALESEGHGQIFANPTLIARSGSEAEFLAGGEFPIRLVGFGSRNVEWKKHGVLLKFKPLADHSGNMSIEVTTELSVVDPASSVDGIPGLKTNRIQSHFDIHGSRTIALSGLIRRDLARSFEGLPGLQRIPILGELFKSRNFNKGHSELFVFVTPEVISPTTIQDPLQLPKGYE